ncbi:propionyl-CoA carboxylase [Advenella kashmirensis WT001]|uniref:Propionyl-CoA carboxylase n=1 Tax=Advenella kashmirensis (strain DSM 17095 / LMG 22695 / WT001) TaxID=1036672 RepID=I3UAA8_ADVKW|nr:hypothetical protein [Advenella kashmirensis]AFK61946.1 propionyl-CoA carboxylase [Advenella kashmirensis WT001]
MQTFEYHGQQWKEEYEELNKRRKMAQAMGASKPCSGTRNAGG